MIQTRLLIGAALLASATLTAPRAMAAGDAGSNAGGAPDAGGLDGSGAPAQRVPTVVACVGDSITAGVGATSGNTRYVAMLQDLLGSGVELIGFGHSGATVQTNSQTPTVPYVTQTEYTGATSFVDRAGAASVVDVIIMLGTNDAQPMNWSNPTASAALFKSEYEKLVDHFTSLSTHPIVYLAFPPTSYSTIPPTNTPIVVDDSILETQIIPIIQTVADEKHMPVIDVHTPTAGHREDFTDDGIHPNDAGHLLIAQTMYAALTGKTAVAIPPAGRASGASAGASSTAAKKDSSGCSVVGEPGSSAPALAQLAPLAALCLLSRRRRLNSGPQNGRRLARRSWQ